ncbi:hypothetical protein [Acidovorax sp. SUPP3334]|uniref:hypothetical protein n=1 Tax=Acidovorax sp. SUPP3334 TaxID=2920881 RepID=UPI0023DE1FD0|nr:hypothetical protein [Acidovorax sp. SUPP3334]GKT21654.1 hypothetical protein AVHM3334_05540 [Acidovorax sp. SUPP3334]
MRLILRTRRRCKTPFGGWWATDAALREIDEVLLLVLRIQPSEIDALEMEDYWWWAGVAERELKRRADAAQRG